MLDYSLGLVEAIVFIKSQRKPVWNIIHETSRYISNKYYCLGPFSQTRIYS